MKWRIPVQRTVTGITEIEAPTLREAMEAAEVSVNTVVEQSKNSKVVVAETDIEAVRSKYNRNLADGGELEPFVVDFVQYRYASIVVWAKNQADAEREAEKVLSDNRIAITYEDPYAEIANVEWANIDDVARLPNIKAEEALKDA